MVDADDRGELFAGEWPIYRLTEDVPDAVRLIICDLTVLEAECQVLPIDERREGVGCADIAPLGEIAVIQGRGCARLPEDGHRLTAYLGDRLIVNVNGEYPRHGE